MKKTSEQSLPSLELENMSPELLFRETAYDIDQEGKASTSSNDSSESTDFEGAEPPEGSYQIHLHGESPPTLSNLSITSESTVSLCHRRNISDCSISSSTEGSRKRHHENVDDDSDDDIVGNARDINGCKQTHYSKDMNIQQMKLLVDKSQTVPVICISSKDDEDDESFDSDEDASYTNSLSSHLKSGQLKGESERSLSLQSEGFSLESEEDYDDCEDESSMVTNLDLGSTSLMSELKMLTDNVTFPGICNEQSLFSELSPHITSSSCLQSKSLFAELSPHLSDISNHDPQSEALVSNLSSELNREHRLSSSYSSNTHLLDKFVSAHKYPHTEEDDPFTLVASDLPFHEDIERDDDDDYGNSVGEHTDLMAGLAENEEKDCELHTLCTFHSFTKLILDRSLMIG